MQLSTLDWLGEENVWKDERNLKFLDYSRHVLWHKCDVLSQNINDLWTLKSSCD